MPAGCVGILGGKLPTQGRRSRVGDSSTRFARSFASIIWLVLVHSCFLLFGRFCGRTCGRRFSEASKPNGTILILSGPKLRRLKFGKTWEAHHCLERCAPALVNFTLSAEAAADFESAATLREILRKPSSIANLPGFSSLRRSEERRVGKECRSRW